MSCCQLITFKDGKPHEFTEYRNSWGGAARIWNSLFDTYLKDPNKEYDSWLGRGPEDRALWDLAKRKDLPLFERAVHSATFDRALIRRENFKQYAGHLREFVKKYPVGGKVDHLTDWASVVKSCDAEAVGFYATSVSENPWYSWNEENEEYVPYDLNTGDDHFEVYEWLKEVDDSEKG